TTYEMTGSQQFRGARSRCDAHGNPVHGETVTIGSGGTGDTVTSVLDNGDGTYTATITSTSSGSSLITATDGPLTDSKTLTKNPEIGRASCRQRAPNTVAGE